MVLHNKVFASVYASYYFTRLRGAKMTHGVKRSWPSILARRQRKELQIHMGE